MEMTILNQLQALDTVLTTQNISDKDLRLSYDNIFALNRIGTNEIVEGGKSSLGFEYENRNKINEKLFGLSLANSMSDRKNTNLPSKTKLNEEDRSSWKIFFFS